MEKLFWLVWSPQGRASTKKHETKEAAIEEAKRLIQNSPFQDFYVLELVHKVYTCHTVQCLEF